MLGLVWPDDDNPALVGDDDVARPYQRTAAGCYQANGAPSGLGRTRKCCSAREYRKAQTPDGAEITHGPIQNESGNAPRFRGYRKNLTPDPVGWVMTLGDQHSTSLGTCNG